MPSDGQRRHRRRCCILGSTWFHARSTRRPLAYLTSAQWLKILLFFPLGQSSLGATAPLYAGLSRGLPNCNERPPGRSANLSQPSSSLSDLTFWRNFRLRKCHNLEDNFNYSSKRAWLFQFLTRFS